MIDFLLRQIAWMNWTIPSVCFFGIIFGSIAVIGINEGFHNVIERKGFLPIATTPGDRLFIIVLMIIGVFLIWLAIFSDRYLLVPFFLSIVSAYIVAVFG